MYLNLATNSQRRPLLERTEKVCLDMLEELDLACPEPMIAGWVRFFALHPSTALSLTTIIHGRTDVPGLVLSQLEHAMGQPCARLLVTLSKHTTSVQVLLPDVVKPLLHLHIKHFRLGIVTVSSLIKVCANHACPIHITLDISDLSGQKKVPEGDMRSLWSRGRLFSIAPNVVAIGIYQGTSWAKGPTTLDKAMGHLVDLSTSISSGTTFRDLKTVVLGHSRASVDREKAALSLHRLSSGGQLIYGEDATLDDRAYSEMEANLGVGKVHSCAREGCQPSCASWMWSSVRNP